MIQLSRKNKIIILAIIISFLLVVIAILVSLKNEATVAPEENNTRQTARPMTDGERQATKIDPKLEADVVNDSNNTFIYKIKN